MWPSIFDRPPERQPFFSMRLRWIPIWRRWPNWPTGCSVSTMSRLEQRAGGRQRRGWPESRGLWRRTHEADLAAGTGRASRALEGERSAPWPWSCRQPRRSWRRSSVPGPVECYARGRSEQEACQTQACLLLAS